MNYGLNSKKIRVRQALTYQNRLDTILSCLEIVFRICKSVVSIVSFVVVTASMTVSTCQTAHAPEKPLQTPRSPLEVSHKS
jgi:hypothetical protein